MTEFTDTDPILEAIRKEILEKQREQLRLYLSTRHPELEEHAKDDEQFRLFLSRLNAEQREIIDNVFSNEKVKVELEEIELQGYRKVHRDFSADRYPGGFRAMSWSDIDKGESSNTRAQIVMNGAHPPEEICTLIEKEIKSKPFNVTRADGSSVTVNNYRTIDFPITLDKAGGFMHLSLVALDKDGNKPPSSKAVYFTAHYIEGRDGKPLLKEVSSSQPIKFMGNSRDAVGYIEHMGQIYTLPVTRGKYEEMMREVAKNKGQSVNLLQEVEMSAQDLLVLNADKEVQEKQISDVVVSLSNKKGPVNYVKNGPLDERTLELPMTNIKITHF